MTPDQKAEALRLAYVLEMYSGDAIEQASALLRTLAAEPREHITDGSPCWCEPTVEYVDQDTGAKVIVHKEPQ